MKQLLFFGIAFWSCMAFAQDNGQAYEKRVLESTEVEMLYSYYTQDGDNAAVTGGEGTEKLNDMTPTIVVSIPLNKNSVLAIDAGVSAYTSASSSNINPFDGSSPASPWVESSGASRSDVLTYFHPSYTLSSKDRNRIFSANLSVSAEFDYFSVGFGAGYTRLYNEKNTELGLKGQVYLDKYMPQYPYELREGFFSDNIQGPGTYDPIFVEFGQLRRNSYSLSLTFSQILSKRLQVSLSVDGVFQEGLLSTPHQRVYLGDRPDFFIDDFQLADDVERLPFYRYKLPIGGRISYSIGEVVTLRGFARYYLDNWGITSYTGNVEVPVKISDKFTITPMYRYHSQTASDYFYPKEVAVSTSNYYTSDYDLSAFDAHQYGIGLSYRDIFTQSKIWRFGLKSVDLRFNRYVRSTGLVAYIGGIGFKFIME